MNCSEVMELMQRQLDHDLDESEQSLLTEHLNACAACTEIFERLKMLNDGLEQLPKVMPKMSLVDSIMPQLEEIDRLHATQQHSNAAKPTDEQAPSLEPIPLSAREYKATQDTQISDPPLIHNRRWLERFNWRTTSAVIAAGIVFGLFMVNYQPDIQESADFPELTAKSEQKSSSANSIVTNMADEESVSTKSSEDSADTAQTTEATDTEAASIAEAPTAMDMGISSSRESENSQLPSIERMTTGDEPGSRMAEPDVSAGSEKSQVESTTKTDSTGSSLSVNHDNQVQELNDKDFQIAVIPEHDENSNEQNGVRSSSMVNMPLLTASPDQQYEAVWEQEQLKIMQKDGETISLLQSIVWKTKPTELRWSEDSKQLTIVSMNDSGQVVEVTYELSDKGLKQIKVMKSDASSPPSSSRSMEGETNNNTNRDVPSNTGNNDAVESSQP